jgi:hypothetical protein
MFTWRSAVPAALALLLVVCRPTPAAALTESQTQTAPPTPPQDPQATPPQQTTPPAKPEPEKKDKKDKKDSKKSGKNDDTSHIFGLLPNYTSVGAGKEFVPLSTKATFVMTAQGAFDKVVFPFTAVTAAIAHVEDQSSSYGRGWEGYAKRYVTSFADNTTATFMTTAIFPTVLRQDPRYFVRGHGGGWSRTGYALSRTTVTLSRTGHKQFNYSDIFGNGAAALVMNTYHPVEDRTVASTLNRWGMQILFDGLTNVLKEFWPDIHRKMKKG